MQCSFNTSILNEGRDVIMNKNQLCIISKCLQKKITLKGVGVPVDRKYKMSIEIGSVEAKYLYGMSFFIDESIKNDKNEGLKYITMASDNGHMDLIEVYEQMLEGGIGVPANEEEAKKHIEMAKNINVFFFFLLYL